MTDKAFIASCAGHTKPKKVLRVGDASPRKPLAPVNATDSPPSSSDGRPLKQKRHVFTIEEKIKIAEHHNKSRNSLQQTAKECGLSKSTIQRIVENYDENLRKPLNSKFVCLP